MSTGKKITTAEDLIERVNKLILAVAELQNRFAELQNRFAELQNRFDELVTTTTAASTTSDVIAVLEGLAKRVNWLEGIQTAQVATLKQVGETLVIQSEAVKQLQQAKGGSPGTPGPVN